MNRSFWSGSIYFLYLLIYPKDDMSAWSEVWATSSPPIVTFPVTGRGCGWKILGTSANDGIESSGIEHIYIAT